MENKEITLTHVLPEGKDGPAKVSVPSGTEFWREAGLKQLKGLVERNGGIYDASLVQES